MIMSIFTLFRQKIIVKNRLSENTLNSINSNYGFALGNLKKHTMNTLNILFFQNKKQNKRSDNNELHHKLYLSLLLKKNGTDYLILFQQFQPIIHDSEFCSESSKVRVCSSSSFGYHHFAHYSQFVLVSKYKRAACQISNEFLSGNNLSHRQPPENSCEVTSTSPADSVDCGMSRKHCQSASQNPGTRIPSLQKCQNKNNDNYIGMEIIVR